MKTRGVAFFLQRIDRAPDLLSHARMDDRLERPQAVALLKATFSASPRPLCRRRRTAAPKASLMSSRVSFRLRLSLASASRSITSKPRFLSKAATVLLPLPIMPVKPIRIIYQGF